MKATVAVTAAVALSCSLMAGTNIDAQTPEGSADDLTAYREAVATLQERTDNLPLVLIIGDSISIGYMATVEEELRERAHVVHNPGNSQGTTHTLANLDDWLADTDFDLIHFNLGLHDIKRVTVAGTADNSKSPSDPRQADLPTYTQNLERIVQRLKKTGARLIFATTTPVPADVTGPHRDEADPPRYNAAAVEIMAAHRVPVNDLYTFVLPRMEALQRERNVHFTESGSVALGKVVARQIAGALPPFN